MASRPDSTARPAAGSCNGRGVGLSLRALRTLRKLSIPEVERLTGFNRATISRVERGIEVPTPAHMLAFSELYDVNPADWRVVLEYRIDEKAA